MASSSLLPADGTSGLDDGLISELQRHFTRPGAKVQVNKDHVAVAVRLALDPALVVGTVCKAAGIAKGKATSHMAEWRKQIVAGDLLAVCAASVQQDPGPTSGYAFSVWQASAAARAAEVDGRTPSWPP